MANDNKNNVLVFFAYFSNWHAKYVFVLLRIKKTLTTIVFFPAVICDMEKKKSFFLSAKTFITLCSKGQWEPGAGDIFICCKSAKK